MVQQLKRLMGRTDVRILVLLACGLFLTVLALSIARAKTSSLIDSARYDCLLSWEMRDVGDLEAWYADAQSLYLPLAPPSTEPYLQRGTPGMLPFKAKNFPAEFVKGLVGEYVNGVEVFPVIIVEDSETAETVFFNARQEEIYADASPGDYSPDWFV